LEDLWRFLLHDLLLGDALLRRARPAAAHVRAAAVSRRSSFAGVAQDAGAIGHDALHLHQLLEHRRAVRVRKSWRLKIRLSSS
jgi:hypothetical protein